MAVTDEELEDPIDEVNVPDEGSDDSDDEDAEEPFPEYDENDMNLVDAFMESDAGEDELEEIAKKVAKDFEVAFDSTTAYRERMKEIWKMFAGELDVKDFPWKDCANGNVPILLQNITRLTFRAVDELFGDWRNVFGVSPVGQMNDELARNLSLHGNWQIREQIPDFKRQMHRGMLMFFTFGDVTAHSYYDETSWLNRHDVLTPEEFVVPYRHVTTSPNYADVPYRIRIIYKHRHELQQLADLWYGVDEILEDEATYDDEPDSSMSEEVNKTQGNEKPEETNGAPYKLLWYEGWLTLPNQEKDRFCKVIYHPGTEKILLLAIHEAPNWQDQVRHDAQVQELVQYRGDMQQHLQMVQQQQMQQQATVAHVAGMAQQGQLTDQQANVAGQGLAQMIAQPQPQPPPAPKWLGDQNPMDSEASPEPPRMEPIHLFAHGVCIEPLMGNLGIGFGRIQADFNDAANTLVNQFVDASTLNNCGGFVVPASVKFSDEGMAPGKIRKVTGLSGEDIRKDIMPFQTPPANNALLELADKMYGWAESAIQAPDVLSGESGKSGETFRGLSARIEQATKQLSVPTREFGDFLTQILKNNALLNSMYLRDEEIAQVVDQQGVPTTVKVSRDSYRRNYQLTISSDMRFTSQAQRIQEADDALGLIMKVPMAAANPNLVMAALAKCFEARNKPEFLKYLVVPPPMPPQLPAPNGAAPNAPPAGQAAPPAGGAIGQKPAPAGIPGPKPVGEHAQAG